MTASLENEIPQAVEKSLKAFVENGGVQQIVDERVQNVFKRVISDLTGHGSDFENKVLEIISKVLGENITLDTFAGYNEFMRKRLQAVAKNYEKQHLVEAVDMVIDRCFDNFPKHMKLTDLLDGFIGDDSDNSLSLSIKRSGYDALNVCIGFSFSSGTLEDKVSLHLYPKNEGGNKYQILSIEAPRDDRLVSPSREMMFVDFGMMKKLKYLFAVAGTIEFDLGLDADEYSTSYKDQL